MQITLDEILDCVKQWSKLEGYGFEISIREDKTASVIMTQRIFGSITFLHDYEFTNDIMTEYKLEQV